VIALSVTKAIDEKFDLNGFAAMVLGLIIISSFPEEKR
jgi:hypothetical protein